ncbi:leucine-rich repeat-containing G-protein coupled receptor 4-like [Haliotis asinina]|uniref:leucine-rich repeat-containing G-protein coupled receptor 4-like n=1 Tax=Haliotis asinina TaxID=109174 RepID=UPI00353271B4
MKLEDGAFSNLHDSLEYLNLEITKIFFNKTLPFLRGLSRLEYLDLSFNNKYHYESGDPNISSRLFDGLGLSSLKTLKMYNSNIQSLGADVFLGIETLEELDLAGNLLPGVPDGLARLSALKVLDLSNSRFTTLRRKSFVNNKKLMTLKMFYSKVTTIDPDAFVGLEKSLQVLKMQQCKLSKFPTDALKHLTALKVLDLQMNPLATIPDGSLSGSFCLKDLHIGQTYIKVTCNIFKGQENCIKNLYLRDMGLDNIPTESLRSLKKLQHLFLTGNEIKVLCKDSLTGIKASLLVFHNNPLARIEKGAFQNLTHPFYLDFQETLLKDLQFTFD